MLSDQVWIRYQYLKFKNCLFSIVVSLQKLLAHFYTAGKLIEIMINKPRKTKISSPLLIISRFQQNTVVNQAVDFL